MSARSSTLRGAVAASLLALGVAVFVLLSALQAPPERRAAPDRRVVVETIPVERREHRLEIHAEGTLQPRRVLAVRPEVSGTIVWLSPAFELGGVVEAGERLFQIEERDYRLAVRRARAALTRARSALEMEKGRQNVARREFELFADRLGPLDEEAKQRALRIPELRSAEAEVRAAEASVAEAEANLERTTAYAPFDAYVRDESIEEGALVSAGQAIATLVGTDAFWVEIAIPQDRLSHIDLSQGPEQLGSPARIAHDVGDVTVERRGRVEKLLGDLEERSRLARLLIRVDDPLDLESLAGREQAPDTALLAGAFVRVVVMTDTRAPLIEVPQRAVRDGDMAYVYTDAGTLDIRPLAIAWRETDSVMVRAGLDDGDRVIVSPLSRPIQGMKLRTDEDSPRTSSEAVERPRRAPP